MLNSINDLKIDIEKIKSIQKKKDIKIVDKFNKNAKINFGEIVFDKSNNNLYIYLDKFYKMTMEDI